MTTCSQEEPLQASNTKSDASLHFFLFEPRSHVAQAGWEPCFWSSLPLPPACWDRSWTAASLCHVEIKPGALCMLDKHPQASSWNILFFCCLLLQPHSNVFNNELYKIQRHSAVTIKKKKKPPRNAEVNVQPSVERHQATDSTTSDALLFTLTQVRGENIRAVENMWPSWCPAVTW